MIKGMELVN